MVENNDTTQPESPVEEGTAATSSEAVEAPKPKRRTRKAAQESPEASSDESDSAAPAPRRRRRVTKAALDETTEVEAPAEREASPSESAETVEQAVAEGAAAESSAADEAEDAADATATPETGAEAPAGGEVTVQDAPSAAEDAPARPSLEELVASATGPFPLFLAPPPLPARAAVADGDEDEAESASSGTSRRRRSRGRGTGGAAESTEQPREQREAREPREREREREPREPVLITEPQKVKGSTRLEAKKQRRRDGRDAGRRRPVVTEAEFLARRESVERVMVVRSKSGRIQIGVLEDGILVEHYVARSSEASLIGNVYLGKVQNVLPSMEAAFVDIGRGRNAVLYSGEVDWEAAAANAAANAPEGEAPPKNQPRRIELALKPGDRVLVQVTKDPVGHKGARLTSQVSLPGRYLVYVPSGSMSGISRKLPDTERARLKKILKEIVPTDAGVIVRTAAEGATEEQLGLDVTRLQAQWEKIAKAVEKGDAPKLLHSEPDLLIKIIRDVFNEDFSKLVVSGDDALSTIADYLGSVAPDLMDRLERYEGERDAFDEYRISEQIDKALERKVWLPSGGSLVIDRTEAMTVIDVNTGKFVGSGGNLEETVTKNNLEAAEEIVRQLRLRDIGGIIVIDFIDMVLENNRDLVLRRLIECLSRDRTKHQVAEVTSLGLVQMTRKKLGLGLLETFSEPCEVCAGRGIIVHHEPVIKHRGGSSSNGGSENASGGSSRRRKGGSGAAASAPAAAPKADAKGGAHALTGDVLNAIAQVAKSTVQHDAAEPDAAAAEQAAPAPDAASDAASNEGNTEAPAESVTPGDAPAAEEAPAAESSGADSSAADAPAEEASDAATGAPVTIPVLDIELPLPVEHAAAPVPTRDPADVAKLLDSVLDALPSSPAPRARRSRRVSSGPTVPPTE